jgi:hypothetical protein
VKLDSHLDHGNMTRDDRDEWPADEATDAARSEAGSEPADSHTTLVAAVRKILKQSRWTWVGYGNLRCASCGAFASQDDETGIIKAEPCSAVCPWRVLEKLAALHATKTP